MFCCHSTEATELFAIDFTVEINLLSVAVDRDRDACIRMQQLEDLRGRGVLQSNVRKHTLPRTAHGFIRNISIRLRIIFYGEHCHSLRNKFLWRIPQPENTTLLLISQHSPLNHTSPLPPPYKIGRA